MTSTGVTDTRYDRVDKVKSRVEKVLRDHIPGLEDLVIQVEGVDGMKSCFCMVTSG